MPLSRVLNSVLFFGHRLVSSVVVYIYTYMYGFGCCQKCMVVTGSTHHIWCIYAAATCVTKMIDASVQVGQMSWATDLP